MKKSQNIGLFDSGLGGLTILKECIKMMPGQTYHYIGDQDFHPYGDKSDAEIVARSSHLVRLLEERKCDHIIVACNTATAVAIEELRRQFAHINFIGVEPYLNALTKYEFSSQDRIGVLVTRRTMESRRFAALQEKLDPKNSLAIHCLSQLAPFIEDCIGHQRQESDEFRKELTSILHPILAFQWSHIILGCTHYPLVKEDIEEITGATCLNPASAVARRLKSFLEPLQADGRIDDKHQRFFYHSTKNNAVVKWEEKFLDDFIGR